MSSISLGVQKVALVTSLDLEEIKEKFSEEQRNRFEIDLDGHPSYFEMLEEKLTSFFPAPEYDTQIYHWTDQHQLSQILQSGKYAAIFWVSHGGFSPREGPGLLSQGILDYMGFEITPIFQKVHPSVQFLGVVSCGSKIILNDLFRNQVKTCSRMHTFDTPVDVKKALLFSLQKGKKRLSQVAENQKESGSTPVEKKTEEEDWIWLHFVRTCISQKNDSAIFFPSLRIQSNSGDLIATLPSCTSGEKVESVGRIRKSEKTWNISIHSGDRLSQKPISFELGNFEVTSEEGNWELFRKKRDGLPQGSHTRVFIFEH